MEINYIIQKSRRKSISIHISQDEKVMVNAPLGMPVEKVEEFLRSKRIWIIRHLEKVHTQNEKAEIQGYYSKEELKAIIKKAHEIIPQRVEYYAGLTGISYRRIFIRLQKTRWGSCSADGNLNFNCLLAAMPLEILDSVVVHELCHRHHMNHSKAFYSEVISIFPDYKKCDKWLKENGPVYFQRISKIK